MPVVLLTLGALCLLVAAVVFVAVTWSLLGLTGRTVVLLGFTALLAGIAVLLTRRGLRGASETFWVVVAGMLTVDLLAAQSAGLAGLDALDWRGTSALVGGALLALGVGVGTWASSQPVRRLYGAEVFAALGVLVLCLGNGWLADNPAVGTTVAIPLLAGLAVLLRRSVPLTAYAAAGLAVVSWLYLLGLGWERALEDEHPGGVVVRPAGLATPRRSGPGRRSSCTLPGVPAPLRPVAAGAALLPLLILANAPYTVDSPTRDLLGWSASLRGPRGGERLRTSGLGARCRSVDARRSSSAWGCSWPWLPGARWATSTSTAPLRSPAPCRPSRTTLRPGRSVWPRS